MVSWKTFLEAVAVRRQRGLRSEILVSLGLIMFTGVLFMGATALRAAEKTILLQKLESLTQVTRAIQIGLTGWWGRDGAYPELQAVLDQAAPGMGISSFKVSDGKGRVVAGLRNQELGLSRDPHLLRALATGSLVVPGEVTGTLPDAPRGSWTFAAPVFKEGVRVGAFAVSYPLENLGIVLNFHRKVIYTFALIDGLVIVLFGGWLIGRVAIRPMVRISEGAAALAGGDYDTRVPVQGPKEVAALAKAFNAMAEKVQGAVRQQEEHLTALERINWELTTTQREMVRVEKLASVGQLAAGIAHEIGNPLSAILGYASILQREEKDPESEQYLGHIVKETERIQRIIGGLVEFSRPRETRLEDVAVNTLVRAAVDLVAPQKVLRGVAIRVSPAPEDPLISGDGHQLQQVLINILINAGQAMDGEGELDIVIRLRSLLPEEVTVPRRRASDLRRRRASDPQHEDYVAMRRSTPEAPALHEGDQVVAITVRDTGPGIAADALGRIFDPFFTTKGTGAGTGLGLAIAHGIVEAHGGRLWAENPEGGGARFTILLPLENHMVKREEGDYQSPTSSIQSPTEDRNG